MENRRKKSHFHAARHRIIIFLVYVRIMEHVYAILCRALFFLVVVIVTVVVSYLNADAFYKVIYELNSVCKLFLVQMF